MHGPIGRSLLSRVAIACWLVWIVAVTGTPSLAQEMTPKRNNYRILVKKSDQVLDLYRGNSLVKSYKVCLGLNPSGPKKVTGDTKTPEGDYFICYKTESSKFCRFLGISYPSPEDAMRAFETGTISLNNRNLIVESGTDGKTPLWDTVLGGWVGIHGYPTDEYKKIWTVLFYPKPHNWTDGCIAMWDFEILELYSVVGLGTPVRILP